MSEIAFYNEAAEQAILGGLLSDNAGFDRVPNLLPEHFYVGDNQLIFMEMRKQLSDGRKVDAITLNEAVKRHVPDSFKYLAQLHANSAGAARIQYHAEIVIGSAQRRTLAKIGADLLERAKTSSEAPEVIREKFASLLDKATCRNGGIGPMLMADCVSAYSDLLERRRKGLVRPVKTGYSALDDQLGGGLERGSLTVLAGRPGMGKTALALGAARNVSECGVSLLLSMEMPRNDIMDRYMSAIGNVPLTILRKLDDCSDEEQKLVNPALLQAPHMRLLIDDETALSALAIHSKARQAKRLNGGLDLLVIDQLSYITASQKFDNPAYAIGEITRSLVALSKDLDCAVLLLAQLNRDCEKRPDRRPILADLALVSSGCKLIHPSD